VAAVAYFLALTIHLHLPDNGSLKGKRRELLAVKAAIVRRFGATVAEVDHHDLWQRSTLAAGLVGASIKDLERAETGLERYLDNRFPEGFRIERRLVSFSDLN